VLPKLVRACAIARRTLSERHSSHVTTPTHFQHFTTILPTKHHILLKLSFFKLKQAMEDSIVLSPSAIAAHKPSDNWKTPIRATVRFLRQQGKSYGEIVKLTTLKRSTIQSIIKAPTSRTTRKGLATKRPALKQADIKRIFRFVSESWTNRTKS
jgi:hypothetical protein